MKKTLISIAWIAASTALADIGPDTILDNVPGDATVRQIVEAGGGGGSDTNAVELIANRAVETNGVTVALSAATNDFLRTSGGRIDGDILVNGTAELAVQANVEKLYVAYEMTVGEKTTLSIAGDRTLHEYGITDARAMTNNVCAADSFGGWSVSVPVGQAQPNGTLRFVPDEGWAFYNGDSQISDYRGDWNSTHLEWHGFESQAATDVIATRSRVSVSNDTFATWSPVTNAVARAISATDPTFSNAVLSVGIDGSTLRDASSSASMVSNVVFNSGKRFLVEKGEFRLVDGPELVWSSNYGLTNVTAVSGSSVVLNQGEITRAEFVGLDDRFGVVLKFSTDDTASGDAILRVVSSYPTTITSLAVDGYASVSVRGAKDWNVIPAGDVLVMFTKTAVSGGAVEVWVNYQVDEASW